MTSHEFDVGDTAILDLGPTDPRTGAVTVVAAHDRWCPSFTVRFPDGTEQRCTDRQLFHPLES